MNRRTDLATTDEIGAAPSDRTTTEPRDDQTNEKGTATMKLTTTTFVSVYGVMQGIGANGAIADGSRYGLAIEG